MEIERFFCTASSTVGLLLCPRFGVRAGGARLLAMGALRLTNVAVLGLGVLPMVG
jgi:hypothetical protein